MAEIKSYIRWASGEVTPSNVNAEMGGRLEDSAERENDNIHFRMTSLSDIRLSVCKLLGRYTLTGGRVYTFHDTSRRKSDSSAGKAQMNSTRAPDVGNSIPRSSMDNKRDHAAARDGSVHKKGSDSCE